MRLLGLLFLLALPQTAWAQEPRFRAHFADAALSEMRLAQLSADGLLHLSGKEDKIVDARELVSLRREKWPLPELPAPPFLLLTTGERLPLAAKPRPKLKDNRLLVVLAPPLTSAEKEIGVPLPYVGLLCLDYPHADEEAELVLGRVLEPVGREASPMRKNDLALLASGDRVEGKLVRFDGKECVMEAAGRTVEMPLKEVAVLALSPDKLILPRIKKEYNRAVIAKGGRVDFQTLSLDQARGVLSGKTLFGAAVEFPLKDLVALQTRQGRAVYLSDLAAEYRHDSGGGLAWPLGRDRTFLGRPLRLSDGLHDKGLSMPVSSEVTFKLEGAWAWFEAWVGLDARDGRLGRAAIEVWVDDKKRELPIDQDLQGEAAPVALRIDVRKARALRLVTRGGRPAVQTVVNWADARLVKGS